MARPKALDPKIQRNFYPPVSMWERVESAALADKIKAADLVLIFVEKGLNDRESMIAEKRRA